MEKRPYPGSKFSMFIPFTAKNLARLIWPKYNSHPCAKFQRINIERNVGGELDVTIDVKFCGVCHSDVHIADNDMGTTQYPCVPGHELAGVVVRKAYLIIKTLYKPCIMSSLQCWSWGDQGEGWRPCGRGLPGGQLQAVSHVPQGRGAVLQQA